MVSFINMGIYEFLYKSSCHLVTCANSNIVRVDLYASGYGEYSELCFNNGKLEPLKLRSLSIEGLRITYVHDMLTIVFGRL